MSSKLQEAWKALSLSVPNWIGAGLTIERTAFRIAFFGYNSVSIGGKGEFSMAANLMMLFKLVPNRPPLHGDETFRILSHNFGVCKQERATIRLGIVAHSYYYYRAMHVVLARYCYRKSSVRPSVCLSVSTMLLYRGHIGWTSSKLITRIISLGSSLLGATTSPI